MVRFKLLPNSTCNERNERTSRGKEKGKNGWILWECHCPIQQCNGLITSFGPFLCFITNLVAILMSMSTFAFSAGCSESTVTGRCGISYFSRDDSSGILLFIPLSNAPSKHPTFGRNQCFARFGERNLTNP